MEAKRVHVGLNGDHRKQEIERVRQQQGAETVAFNIDRFKSVACHEW